MAPTAEQIRQDVADMLGEDPAGIPFDGNLADHGLDSVRLMALLERWRGEHGTTASFADLAERPSVDDWVQLLGTE